MSATERRHLSRTKLDKLAYIHIEPDNGGIILNVSGEGLAFHSMAPVKKNGAVHFSLKEQNRRIDVCGELIWTDEIQKIGGLRFTTLPNEAREQIENWTSQPETAHGRNGSSLGAAVLRVFPSLSVRKIVPKLKAADRLASLQTKVRLRMSGFSGGLATGLLISILTSFIIFFCYTHRQQLGESLIHIGQRLAGTSESQPQSIRQNAENPVSLPAAKTSIPSAPTQVSNSARPQSAAHTNTSTPPQAKVQPRQTQPVVRAQPSPASTTPVEKAPPKTKTTVGQAASNSQPTKPSQPLPAVTRGNLGPTGQQVTSGNDGDLASIATSNSITPLPSTVAPSSTSASAAQNEPVGQVKSQSLARDPALPLQMFFDLGKFKKQQVAQDLSDRVAQLGMRTSVVSKGRLWMNSYQVLVGPYTSVDEEKKIHGDLGNNGIKARPFERGSRGFAFRSGLNIAGTKLPVGEFTISWETYVAEAKVKFVQNGSVLATAEGKWIAHPERFEHNEYVYENVGGSSRPLVEVHFAGMNRALVFR